MLHNRLPLESITSRRSPSTERDYVAFRGKRCIVGPRPHAVAHNAFYRRDIKGYMRRHKVKPGNTGQAQGTGWRGETDDRYKTQRRMETILV